jgi:geranylgeranyl reductase family protein
MFDVIVVGAGPAGSTAAKNCAEKGMNTVLIEKQSIPRSKPCGGGVSLKAVKMIEGEIPARLIEQKVKGFRFFSPSLDSVDLISEETMGISVKRDKFDEFLTRLAVKSGCELIQSNGLKDFTVNKDGVVCRLDSGKTIRGSIIIGADGANGNVAKKAKIRKEWKSDEVGLCLESDIALCKADMDKIDLDVLELYFINIPFGYGWLFPKKSSISVGIGGSLKHINNPGDIFNGFCKTVSELKGIDLGKPKFEAHLAPFGGVKRKIVADRMMLIGDAAGFIDPFTGEGIYYAMRSGQIAARACKKSLDDGQTKRAFFEKNYAKVCDEDFVKDLKVALRVNWLVHNHFDRFFNILKGASGKSIVNFSTGATSYRTLQKTLVSNLLRSAFRIRND